MKKNKFGILFLVAVIIIGLGYTPVSSYIYKSSHKKFGRAYNPVRAGLGIPLIEENWVVEKQYNHAVFWLGNELAKGHQRKTVSFNGLHIRGELDLYNLSKQAGKRRWLETEYLYKDDKSILPGSFSYQVENDARHITAVMADSILKAEGIKNSFKK